MTRRELRSAITYHRKYHRPFLFAARPGPMSTCRLPTCEAVMAQLREDHDLA